MIEVGSAITSEERERDEPRNRILLTLGKKKFRLSRVEAVKLVQDLQKILKNTECVALDGVLIIDGRDASIVTKDDEKYKLRFLDYRLYQMHEERVRLSGVHLGENVFQVMDFSED